jgi:hypothetical protein
VCGMGRQSHFDACGSQSIIDSVKAPARARFVLKDGTEIHRISPPALIYDSDTLIRHLPGFGAHFKDYF